MLRITRKVGETIVVNEGDQSTFITISASHGGRVHLLIDGPREVRVDRLEIRAKRDRERANEGGVA